ncbi:MAG TPA: hypothetical protein VF719_12810 [Abditibacteriaceae bacterium]
MKYLLLLPILFCTPSFAQADNARRTQRADLPTVEPEALAVLSRAYNATLFISDYQATIVREYNGSYGPANRVGDWTRADVQIRYDRIKAKLYWPARSAAFLSDGTNLYQTDSRYPLLHTKTQLPKHRSSSDLVLQSALHHAHLSWGALSFLYAQRTEFGSWLLNRNFRSANLTAPVTIDGVECDRVEIILVNERGERLSDELAIGRSDGFVRRLVVKHEPRDEPTVSLSETYYGLRVNTELSDPRAALEPRWTFAPPRGARKVANFGDEKK